MPESLPSKKPEVEETLQFLKREEVRTMAKDIAQLHEGEAKTERERIAKIKTAEPKKDAQTPTLTLAPQPILQAREENLKPSLMPHAKDLPDGRQGQKPVFLRARARSEKILIRAIVIGVLLFILFNGLAFGYWYFTKKKMVETAPSPQPTPSTEPASASPAIAPQSEGVAPAALVFFDTAQEKTIDLSVSDNLLVLLSGALKEEYLQGFTRILIKKSGGAAFLTTRELLNTAGVAMPEPLLSILKEDFMLFVYSSPSRKRLGLMGELSQTEGVQEMLRSWETTLEQDTKPLWEIVGQKGSAYTPFFRQAVHQNNLVRFQTFSVLDFGVVYTLFGTKLILSTSFESVAKAVDLFVQSGP